MIYMTSINSSSGLMRLRVDFDVGTDPNTDQILTQMRYPGRGAASDRRAQLRCHHPQVGNQPAGAVLSIRPREPTTALSSRTTRYQHQRSDEPCAWSRPGSNLRRGQVRDALWVRPDTLASLGITVSDIIAALNNQNTVNPSGQIGAEPVRPGRSSLTRFARRAVC